jgi:hypothetical protein
MDSFWGSLFEHLKQCGRNAAIFLVALALVVGLLLISISAGHSDLLPFVLGGVAGIGLCVVLRLAISFRRNFLIQRERLRFPQLSSDEVTKARSKLLNNRERRSV